MKRKLENSIAIILTLCIIWIAISSTIQRFKCISLTETEILIRIPKSFILDWKNCYSYE